ncbi:tol-pal system-associated acyl-CoA thioesterase [Rhodovulum sp. DZ06]|uniref:tol-pal system-associated acyl-CoA thioesterase n=1 Tax=Rhodovulum sp. DZ06 TaxID=3425126 RepID=UPI003D3585D5
MHRFTTRVFYEDTDMAGIVYHANYLKFIERARSDALREAGIDQNAMREDGLVFVVRSMECDWLAPARYEDLLEVTTTTETLKRASATLRQEVLRGAKPLFRAAVLIACMGEGGGPRRIPDAAAAALGRMR